MKAAKPPGSAHQKGRGCCFPCGRPGLPVSAACCLKGAAFALAILSRCAHQTESFTMLFWWLCLLLQTNAAAGCSGEACEKPCACVNGDVECNDKGITQVPCHIPASADGIYLSNNSIHTIAPGDLSKLGALQYIFMDHNKLTAIDGEMLSGLSSLGELLSDGAATSSHRVSWVKR